MFLLELSTDRKVIHILSEKKKIICVFPKRRETCLICDRKTVKTESSQTQSILPIPPKQKSSKEVARKGSHESHGPFPFLEISTFSYTVSLKLRKLCRLPQIYFKDFYKGKFHNHQSTPNNVHNHEGLTVCIHSYHLLPPYSFSLIIWLPHLPLLMRLLEIRILHLGAGCLKFMSLLKNVCQTMSTRTSV